MSKRIFINYLKGNLLLIGFLFLVCSGTAMAAERYAVTGKIANIRSGPGTKHDILCQAERYYPLKVLKKSGNWYQVEDFEGDVGWIHKSLVSKMSSVITIKPKCNVRSGPSTKYQIVLITERGVPFKVVERKGNWIHVRHSEEHVGWIHKSLVW